MAPRYINKVKPNPRAGQKFTVVQKGGQTFHKYGPGRLFSGGPRPKVTPPKPVKPVVARPLAPAPVGQTPAPVVQAPKPAVQGPPAPPDPRYDSDIAGLQKTRDDTLAGISAQRTQSLLGYGYNEGANGALTFDVNNPLSRAAQLKRNYDASRRRTGNTMASSGGLYAGAYQSAQDVVNRGQVGAEDTLQTSLAEFLARNTASRGRAQTAYETGASQAESERVGRIEDNPLYEPTVGYGSPVSSGRPAAGRSASGVVGGGRQALASLGPKKQAIVAKAIKQGKPLPAGTLASTNLTAPQKEAVRALVKKKGK